MGMGTTCYLPDVCVCSIYPGLCTRVGSKYGQLNMQVGRHVLQHTEEVHRHDVRVTWGILVNAPILAAHGVRKYPGRKAPLRARRLLVRPE